MRTRTVTAAAAVSTALAASVAAAPPSGATSTARGNPISAGVAGAVVYGNIARNMIGVWTVPKTSCRSLTTRGDTPTTSAWVELGVYSVDKVELGAAGVNINCKAGAASFVPYTLHNTTGETDYTGSDTPVQPNDVIVVHVTASVQRVASVTNLTRRWTRTLDRRR